MEKKTTKPLAQEIDNIITSDKDNITEENNTTPEEPIPTPTIEEEQNNKIEETPEPTEQPRNKPIIIDRLYRF